jgi:L-iditol 2-dehydrogenase
MTPEVSFLATPPVHGDLARYHTHPADFCYKLPDNVSFEEGAMLEPISVGIHACRRAGIKLGDRVLICGAGPIGLVNMLVARAMGASVIAITDLSDSRLKIAKQMGANHAIKVDRNLDSRGFAEAIVNVMGENPDVTIECSGVESSLQTGIYATKQGGVMMLVGLGQMNVKVPLVHAAQREIDLRGVFRYANTYPMALAMVASGLANVKPLVSHRYKLENCAEAFEAARDEKSGAIKIVIQCAAD